MSLRIRPMTISDLDHVLAIAETAVTAPRWPRESYQEAIGPGSRRIALVAEQDGLVAGFAVMSILPPQAELESIAVASRWLRHGVATALLQDMMEAARWGEATELLLEVRASNRAAAELYARAGFLEVGRRPGYYADPVEDAVILRLGLWKSGVQL